MITTIILTIIIIIVIVIISLRRMGYDLLASISLRVEGTPCTLKEFPVIIVLLPCVL